MAGDGRHPRRHPRWLGWVGALIGLTAMVSAVVLGLRPETLFDLFDRIVYPVVVLATIVWVLTLGVLTWRTAARVNAAA